MTFDPVTDPDYHRAAEYLDTASHMVDMALVMHLDPGTLSVLRSAHHYIEVAYDCCKAMAEKTTNKEGPTQ